MSDADYARGRADAARAIRHAAEQVLPGSQPDWLQPGTPWPPVAADVQEWLTEWAAKIAEHGEVGE